MWKYKASDTVTHHEHAHVVNNLGRIADDGRILPQRTSPTLRDDLAGLDIATPQLDELLAARQAIAEQLGGVLLCILAQVPGVAELHPVLRGTRHRRLEVDGVVGSLSVHGGPAWAGKECSMDPVQGARTFQTTGEAYDAFMGRYSYPLAVLFADAADVTEGLMTLDIGCGPGALTGVLVDVLGSGSVGALDPSPAFVSECATRHPGVAVRLGRAEAIPFEDDTFDRVLAQLVLHFVSDPTQAAREFRRVLRPAGLVSACAWDSCPRHGDADVFLGRRPRARSTGSH